MDSANIPQAITRIQTVLGLDDREIARTIGIDLRQIPRWKDGRLPHTKYRAKIEDLSRLCDHLETMFKDHSGILAWLDAPSRKLDTLTPRSVLRKGRITDVRIALTTLDSGVYV